MSSITLSISSASPKSTTTTSSPLSVSLPGSASVAELYKTVAAHKKRSIHRVRLRTDDKKVVIDNDPAKTLQEAGLKDGDALIYKDLGPQVSWRTVFVVEYVGPLIIHPLFFFFGHQIFYKYLPKPWNSNAPFTHSKMQIMAFGMVMAHFIKRELETLFVHRFSNATMPLRNLPKNSAYYWGISGLALAPALYGPWSGAAVYPKNAYLRSTDEYLYPVLGFWMAMQACNFACHLILRNLRTDSNLKQRQIPQGFAFDTVTCPNYFFESMTWLALSVLTWNPVAVIFWLFGTIVMMKWAGGKHRRYKREFGSKYSKNWIMIPGIY